MIQGFENRVQRFAPKLSTKEFDNPCQVMFIYVYNIDWEKLGITGERCPSIRDMATS